MSEELLFVKSFSVFIFLNIPNDFLDYLWLFSNCLASRTHLLSIYLHCHRNHQAWNYEDKTEKEPLNPAIVRK